MIVPWKNIIGSDYEMAEDSDNDSFQEELSGFQSTNTSACLTASLPTVTAALFKRHCYFIGETHRVCSKKISYFFFPLQNKARVCRHVHIRAIPSSLHTGMTTLTAFQTSLLEWSLRPKAQE